MHIEKLSLLNFRNYKQTDLEFPSDVTLIIGKNGSGKTNILESIYFLSTTKSFRTSSDRDLIMRGEDRLKVKGVFSYLHGEIEVALTISNGKKELMIDGVVEKRLSNIIGKILVIPMLFDDIMIITGPPSIRRKFFDTVLSMADPIYFDRLRGYLAVIKHKNSMLRSEEEINRDLLEVWNEKIADYGSYIVKKRIEIAEFFNRRIKGMIDGYTDAQKDKDKEVFNFYITYPFGRRGRYSEEDIRGVLEEKLKKAVEKEVLIGNSIVGPHRDDFIIFSNDSHVRKFGSIGEIRFTSIILRLCQFEYYREMKNEVPILLIDDIFLELDRNRRRFVWDRIEEKSQRIVTSTNLKNLPDNIKYNELIFIEEGNVWKKENLNQ